MEEVLSFNAETGLCQRVLPAPFYYGLPAWLWLRMTGYRDAYGRKAHLMPWNG